MFDTHRCLHIPLIPCLAVPPPCQATTPGLTSSSHKVPREISRAGSVFLRNVGITDPGKMRGQGRKLWSQKQPGWVAWLHGNLSPWTVSPHFSFLSVHGGHPFVSHQPPVYTRNQKWLRCSLRLLLLLFHSVSSNDSLSHFPPSPPSTWPA